METDIISIMVWNRDHTYTTSGVAVTLDGIPVQPESWYCKQQAHDDHPNQIYLSGEDFNPGTPDDIWYWTVPVEV